MFSSDFRIHLGFCGHFKTGRLVAAVDYVGFAKLIQLWEWATANRPDGVLTNMSPSDIEFAVAWPGEKGAFFKALLDIGWLDVIEPESPGGTPTYALHEWKEHNPWAANAPRRADVGRMGKLASHYPEIYHKYLAMGINTISREDYEREVAEYKANLAVAALSNSGDPCAPVPVPNPDSKKDQNRSAAQTNSDAAPVVSVPASKDSADTKPVSPQKSENTKTDPVSPVPAGTVEIPDGETADGVKFYLAPNEVEDILPEHIPQDMTADEVREIRRSIRNEPGYAETLPFLKSAKLRITPFAMANDRRRKTEEERAPKPVSAPAEAAMAPKVPAAPATPTALYRSFPGYQPSKGEDQWLDWLVRLCPKIGRSASTIIQEAANWVMAKGIPVRNARGFLTKWVKRMAGERGIAIEKGYQGMGGFALAACPA